MKNVNSEHQTTRTQLRGYGASHHQVVALTQKLKPIGKKGNTYVYLLTDVVNSIKEYVKKPRVKPKTKEILEVIFKKLLKRLDNVIEIPFVQATNPELSQISKKLFLHLKDLDAYFANLEAKAATIKGKKN